MERLLVESKLASLEMLEVLNNQLEERVLDCYVLESVVF